MITEQQIRSRVPVTDLANIRSLEFQFCKPRGDMRKDFSLIYSLILAYHRGQTALISINFVEMMYCLFNNDVIHAICNRFATDKFNNGRKS